MRRRITTLCPKGDILWKRSGISVILTFFWNFSSVVHRYFFLFKMCTYNIWMESYCLEYWKRQMWDLPCMYLRSLSYPLLRYSAKPLILCCRKLFTGGEVRMIANLGWACYPLSLSSKLERLISYGLVLWTLIEWLCVKCGRGSLKQECGRCIVEDTLRCSFFCRTKQRCCYDVPGLIFAVGGLTNTGDSLSTVEMFDPTTGLHS